MHILEFYGLLFSTPPLPHPPDQLVIPPHSS